MEIKRKLPPSMLQKGSPTVEQPPQKEKSAMEMCTLAKQERLAEIPAVHPSKAVLKENSKMKAKVEATAAALSPKANKVSEVKDRPAEKTPENAREALQKKSSGILPLPVGKKEQGDTKAEEKSRGMEETSPQIVKKDKPKKKTKPDKIGRPDEVCGVCPGCGRNIMFQEPVLPYQGEIWGKECHTKLMKRVRKAKEEKTACKSR